MSTLRTRKISRHSLYSYFFDQQNYGKIFTIFFFFISICFFTYIFINNGIFVKSSSQGIYENVGEGKIFGRLTESKIHGSTTYGGLLGFCSNVNSTKIYGTYPVEKMINNHNHNKDICDSYRPYASQPGFQGQLYSIFHIVGLHYVFYRLFCATLFAIVFSFFLYWVLREFNLAVVLTTTCLFLFQRWSILFGDNIAIPIGLIYLPTVTLLWLLRKNSNHFFSPLFITLLIQWFFVGAEFLFAAIIMPFIPLVYYGILKKYPIKNVIKFGGIIGSAVFLSLLVSGLILVIQINSLGEKSLSGTTYISDSIAKRSVFGDHQQGVAKSYASINRRPASELLLMYYRAEAIKINKFSITFYQIIISITLASLLLIIKNYFTPDIKLKALVIATWVSICAPLSWICLAKGHSYYHIFLDPLVWYFPFLLFGLIVVSVTFSSILSIIARKKYASRK